MVNDLDKESASGGGDDDADDDENEGDFAEFTEDAPNDKDSNEGNDPNNESVDAEVITDSFNGVGGAIHDLLAGFGDLVGVDFDIFGVVDDVFHVMLAS